MENNKAERSVSSLAYAGDFRFNTKKSPVCLPSAPIM